MKYYYIRFNKFEFDATLFELKRLYQDITLIQSLKAGLHHQNFCAHSRLSFRLMAYSKQFSL